MAITARATAVDWPSVYADSALAASNAARCEELVAAGAARCASLTLSGAYAQPFRVQLRQLVLKFWRAYWRTPSYTLARTWMTLVVGFIFGSMYYRQGVVSNPASIGNVQNVMGIIFASTNFLGMTNLMATLPWTGAERTVFYRERGASMYDPFAYGLAVSAVEVPWVALQARLRCRCRLLCFQCLGVSLIW